MLDAVTFFCCLWSVVDTHYLGGFFASYCMDTALKKQVILDRH